MKLLKKCFLLVICLLGILVVAACEDTGTSFYTVEFNSNGGSKVATQTVKAGEVAVKPANPTLEWHDFIGWYQDEALTQEYVFETPVNKNVKLYAKWEQQEVQNVIEILDVEKPTELVLFEANKKEKDNKRTEFKDLTQNYVVGDDNSWAFKPAVSFISVDPVTGNWDEAVVTKWNYVVKVSVLRDTNYEELQDGNEYVESVDAEKASVDFSDKAIGHKFKVEVYPEGLLEEQKESIEDYTVEIEIEVVDGYNAYNALDLAYIDNRKQDDSYGAGWIAFKEEKGLDKEYVPNAVILHKNISIKVEDLPKNFFYNEGDSDIKASDSDYARALGSMRDYVNIYLHNVEENAEFAILGNYFQLSMAELPVVVRADNKITAEGEVISHATLIRFEGSEKGKSSLENIAILGNSPRVQNSIKSGGTILVKVEGPEFLAYNNIVTSSFISYFPNYTSAPFTMDKCKAFDAFNSFVYNWGCDKVTIKDCEMKDAGGPVIIQDHVGHNPDGSGGRVAKTTIINSDLESYVNGQEGWFTIVKATAIVPQIVGMDALFNPFGRSILSTNTTNNLKYFNFICINKSGENEGPTSSPIDLQGSVKIDDYDAFDYGATSQKVATVKAVALQLGNAPYFQTTAGGAAWTDAKTGLFTENVSMSQSGPVLEQIVDPTNPIYQGEYISLYYMGMMIVFEYNVLGTTHTPIA